MRSRLRRTRHLLLTAFAVAACSSAVPQPSSREATAEPGSAPEAAAPSVAGEQLLAQPPAGWRQIGATTLPTLRRAEFAPETEADPSWTHRITFEAMIENPLPDPATFVDLLSAERQQACGTFERMPTFSGEENGYPTSVDLLVCHRDRQSKQSEVMLMKTIRGNEAFYVITRGQRGAPIPAGEEPQIEEVVIGAWAVYLRAVQVCDDSRAGHACPVRADEPSE